MKTGLYQAVAAACFLAVGGTGCSNMTAGENAAVFGGLTAAAVGIPLALAGVDPRITIPVAAGAGVLAGATAYIVAKHQADKEQRRIAEERAQMWMAQQEKEIKQAQRSNAARTSSTTAQSSRSTTKPEPVPEMPRFIAVETAPGTEFRGQSAVMVYDTQKKSLVGNDVFDLKKKPKSGSVTRLDTVQAQYVGEGA
jgi:hypothetical protein